MKTTYCEHIDDYLDDDIEPEELDRWNKHVQECDTCNAAVQQNQYVNSQLKRAWLTVNSNSVFENHTGAVESSIHVRAQTQNTRMAPVAHWLWAIVPLVFVALYMAMLVYFVPSKPELTKEEPENTSPITSPATAAYVSVESKDEEQRDFVETIESNEEYTLVRYHQGVEFNAFQGMANPVTN